MFRFLLVFQALFFFVAGTQIIEHAQACARAEAVAVILVDMPVSALADVRI